MDVKELLSSGGAVGRSREVFDVPAAATHIRFNNFELVNCFKQHVRRKYPTFERHAGRAEPSRDKQRRC